MFGNGPFDYPASQCIGHRFGGLRFVAAVFQGGFHGADKAAPSDRVHFLMNSFVEGSGLRILRSKILLVDGPRALPQRAGIAAAEPGLNLGDDREGDFRRGFRPEIEADRGMQPGPLCG